MIKVTTASKNVNWKEVIKKYALENNIPYADAESLISFYYKGVKGLMRNLEHFRIAIPGLGIMKMHEKKIRKEQVKKTNLVKYLKRPAAVKDKKEDVQNLDKAIQIMEDRRKELKEFNILKKEWKRLKQERDDFKRQTGNSLEEQKPDN